MLVHTKLVSSIFVPLHSFTHTLKTGCKEIIIISRTGPISILKYFTRVYILLEAFEPIHQSLVLIVYASSEAPDEPAHSFSLTSAFAARTLKVGT